MMMMMDGWGTSEKMEDLGSAKRWPYKDQGILRVYLTQSIGCSSEVLTPIVPRLVKCRTGEERCSHIIGWHQPSSLGQNDSSSVSLTSKSLWAMSSHLVMLSDRPNSDPTLMFSATSDATFLTGPPSVTSSKKPRVRRACREDSSGWMVLQNKRGPIGSPCWGPLQRRQSQSQKKQEGGLTVFWQTEGNLALEFCCVLKGHLWSQASLARDPVAKPPNICVPSKQPPRSHLVCQLPVDVDKSILLLLLLLLFSIVVFFVSVLWHGWLGDRKGIRPVESIGCWFVGGDDLTGALHELQLLSPPLSSTIRIRNCNEWVRHNFVNKT